MSSTAPAAHDAGESGAHGTTVVWVLAFCGIVVSLMQTLVVPLLGDLPHLLHTSASNATWVVTSTLLAGAVCTPVFGRLGDMFGKRRILMVSLVLLTVGSVLCALSSSLLPMLAGRLLQGASFGVIPLGIGIMRDELPPAKLGSAVALMSATLGIGGAVGLPLAAFLAQKADWHVMFWSAAALGVIDLVLVALLVRESAQRIPGRFDVPGAVGLSIGLVCLLLAITKGADWGWGSATTLGLFAASVLVLLGWGFMELRTSQPLVNLKTSATPQVLYTNLASIVVGFSMYAMSLVFPQILELPTSTGYGLQKSMIATGLCMAPSGIVMMLVSPLSARLSAARGPKTSLMVGTAIIGVGYAAATMLLDSVWKIVLATMISSTGVALAYAAMPALIMGSVPQSETSAATGLNTLMRSIGTSSSSAVVGMVLANMTSHLATPGGNVLVPSKNGFLVSLWLGFAAAVIGLLVASLIPGRRAAERAGAAAETAPAPAPAATA